MEETIEGCFPPTVTIYNAAGLIELKFEKAENTYSKPRRIVMKPSDIDVVQFRMTFDNTEKRNYYSVYITYCDSEHVLKTLNIYMYRKTTETETRRFYELLNKLKD